MATDYLGNDNWSDISNVQYTLNCWEPFVKSGGRFVLNVPMLVSNSPGTLAQEASGAYDSSFSAVGAQLVANGMSSTILRLGWEFNGSWFPWSVNPHKAGMHSADFIAAWRHLVKLFRAIPGNHFRFDWTVAPDTTNSKAATSYPGNAYVDYVGADIYDTSYGPHGRAITDPTARWDQILNQPYGLTYWNQFARQHHEPMTLPEWGLVVAAGTGSNTSITNGAGDDPSFIHGMYTWIRANHPAFQMYFNAQSSVLQLPSDPKASGEYRHLFGPLLKAKPTPAPAHRH